MDDGEMTAHDERALIREAQRGSSAAFIRLVSGYDAALLALAMRLTAAEPEARRLYRATMMGVYESLAEFRFDCAFSIWIYRQVTRVSLDYLRRTGTGGHGAMDEALQELTPRERMAVEWKHYLGERLEIIGKMLGTTEEAAGKALVSGIRILSMRLNEHDLVNS
jgi:RNA polymerase sigma-70 factor (ECF subfamily)